MRAIVSARAVLGGLLGVLALVALGFAAVFLIVIPLTMPAGPRIGGLGVLNGIAGGVAFVAAFRAFDPTPSRCRADLSLEHVSQLAFTGTAMLCSVFVLTLVLASAGWLPGGGISPETMQIVFAVAAIQGGLGCLLAAARAVAARSCFHYVATVAVHLTACMVLGVAFFVGSSA